jgi:menaquinone-specific isochorismate synthase
MTAALAETLQSYKIVKVAIDITHPIAWLSAQTTFPKVYWKSRDSVEKVATVGAIAEFTELPSSLPLPCFCSLQFHEKSGTYFIPKAILRQKENVSILELILPSENPEEVKKALAELSCVESSITPFTDSPVRRTDIPSRDNWTLEIEKALKAIQQQELEKVVLARQSLLEYPQKIVPESVLFALEEKAQNSTLFYLEKKPGSVFLGATPELFYRREKKKITTEAVAGTRPRGKTFEEDRILSIELLENEKEQREWHSVRSFIDKTVSSFCIEFHEMQNPRIIQAASVQHLYDHFEGTLKEGVTDRELIHTLHPTPAMGGMPRDAAVAFIKAAEPFDRKHYAAPIGWASQDSTELFVAIRSAIIEQNTMRLFAGTGIVEGSTPLCEWNELEHKIKQFIC